MMQLKPGNPEEDWKCAACNNMNWSKRPLCARPGRVFFFYPRVAAPPRPRRG